jgi:cysteinyl-tRNA synthetase
MLKIYNTLTRQKEEFKPIEAGKVGMYVCGVTIYDYCHIGHGRTFVAFDSVARYLRFSGYDLTFIRNITDVDDKIIKQANKNSESCADLTTRFTKVKLYFDLLQLAHHRVTFPDFGHLIDHIEQNFQLKIKHRL